MAETAEHLRVLLLINIAGDDAENEDHKHRLMQAMREKQILWTQE